MNRTRMIGIVGTAMTLLSLAPPASGWTRKETNGPLLSRLLLVYDGDQDVILTVSSIEWGSPDRWSFTARYAHMFDKKADRDGKPWLNNFTVTLCPGTAGGRLGVGYECVYSPKGGKRGSDLAVLSEARAVLLRTWGHPLVTRADRSFVGGELRSSLTGLVNVGVGYYRQVSGVEDDRDSFWGFHVGVGI